MKYINPIKIRGVSLIEVLVALLILSIGILGVIGIFPSVLGHTKSTWNNTQIVFFAQQVMDDLVAKNSFVSTSYSSPVAIPSNITSGTYRYIGYADIAGNTNIQMIKVEVNWVESGRTKKYELISSVAP